jgi:alpha-N-arabinofuranosidase
VSLRGSEWQKYEFSLDLESQSLRPLEPADFVLAARDDTRVLLDQVSLFPDDAIDGMDPDMVAMARATNTPMVRFGGNLTSAYHWRDGVGARDRRTRMLNVAWGIPEYNQFGTDEFLRFCELIGAQPQIALNLGTGTAEEAADWVQYVNGRWANRSGGLLWELGNELWGNFQVGYPTLDRVADRIKVFSDAVRRVDPRAKLIATGGGPDHFEKWNATQLSNGPATFDYLSTHFQESLAHHQVLTAFMEWLFWAENESFPRYDNMGGALGTAGFLNMLLRNADIVPIADMTGILEFGGLWKKRGRVYGMPAYWAFRMYSTADATRPVQVRTDSETYNVENGSSRLPNIGAVPYVDVVAALNDTGDRLTLFCVNRYLTRDVSAHIRIDGFRPKSAVVHSLYADNLCEKNTRRIPMESARRTPLWKQIHPPWRMPCGTRALLCSSS